MQKLTRSDLQKIELKSGPYKESKAADYYKAIASLLVGEGVLITKLEWPLKGFPQNHLPKRYRLIDHAEYSVRTTADDTAFVVTREA